MSDSAKSGDLVAARPGDSSLTIDWMNVPLLFVHKRSSLPCFAAFLPIGWAGGKKLAKS